MLQRVILFPSLRVGCYPLQNHYYLYVRVSFTSLYSLFGGILVSYNSINMCLILRIMIHLSSMDPWKHNGTQGFFGSTEKKWITSQDFPGGILCSVALRVLL